MEMLKGVNASDVPLCFNNLLNYETANDSEYAIFVVLSHGLEWLFIRSRQTDKIYRVKMWSLVEEAIKQGIDDNSEEVPAQYSDEERRVIDCIAASYEEGEQ